MKKLLYFIVFIIILGFIGLQSFNSWYNSAIFKGHPEQQGNILELTVEEGETFMGVVQNLVQEKVINNKLAVQIYLKRESISPNIKAGSYKLDRSSNVPTIIEVLEKGALKPSTGIELLYT